MKVLPGKIARRFQQIKRAVGIDGEKSVWDRAPPNRAKVARRCGDDGDVFFGVALTNPSPRAVADVDVWCS